MPPWEFFSETSKHLRCLQVYPWKSVGTRQEQKVLEGEKRNSKGGKLWVYSKKRNGGGGQDIPLWSCVRSQVRGANLRLFQEDKIRIWHEFIVTSNPTRNLPTQGFQKSSDSDTHQRNQVNEQTDETYGYDASPAFRPSLTSNSSEMTKLISNLSNEQDFPTSSEPHLTVSHCRTPIL